jgi:hypothetical protein
MKCGEGRPNSHMPIRKSYSLSVGLKPAVANRPSRTDYALSPFRLKMEADPAPETLWIF